ncbi:MAG: hypothetical protein KDD36_13655 [Flavobacteriales bacterium]|nr:hypothetical protein [Flavobacteriales bacterium]
MSRGFVAALLFACLIAPFTIGFLWLQYQKDQVRHEVKKQLIAGIDPSELVLVKCHNDETQQRLRWEHDREFEFKGNMYDVVSFSIIGDTTYYRCWLDSEETQLNKQLNILMAGTWDGKRHRQHQELVLHFYKNLYSIKQWQLSFAAIQIVQNDWVPRDSLKIYSRSPSPPVPPPEIA